MLPAMRLALALVPLAACGFAADDPISHYVENEGEVCLHSSTQLASTQMFEADARVVITYQSTTCLSSSCDLGRFAWCGVSGTGPSLAITSAAAWSSDSSPEACTDDCGLMNAQCMTVPLAEGAYAFTFGAETIALTVPSTLVEAPCARTR